MNRQAVPLVRMLHFPVRALGPGTRIGLWLQGCNRRCAGCITPEGWEFDRGMSMPPDELTGRIRSYMKNDPRPDGITISGGEPFDQPDALRWIISAVHASGLDDVLIYSGYGWPEIAHRFPWITDHPAAIVDGPFELGNPTDEVWKGSENQSLVLLGEHLKERYAAWASGKTRRMQYAASGGGKFLIGIPRQGDAEVFSQLRKFSQLWHLRQPGKSDR